MFIDLTNLAKGLINENQQLSVEQELERLFPSTRRVGGRKGRSREHRVRGKVEVESIGLALVNRLLRQLISSF